MRNGTDSICNSRSRLRLPSEAGGLLLKETDWLQMHRCNLAGRAIHTDYKLLRADRPAAFRDVRVDLASKFPVLDYSMY